MASSADQELSFAVVEMLAIDSDSPSKRLLPILMRYVQSEENYGNPNLIQQIPKFGIDVREYLPEVRRIRARILAEISLDPISKNPFRSNVLPMCPEQGVNHVTG